MHVCVYVHTYTYTQTHRALAALDETILALRLASLPASSSYLRDDLKAQLHHVAKH